MRIKIKGVLFRLYLWQVAAILIRKAHREVFGQTDLESGTVVAEDEHLVVLANFGSVQGEKTVFRPVQNSRVDHAFPLCVPRIKTKYLFKA